MRNYDELPVTDPPFNKGFLYYSQNTCVKKSTMHKFYVTSSSWQQGVGNKINLRMDDGWELNFVPGTDNTLLLRPCKNKNTYDLNLGQTESNFQNPPFYLHFLANTSSVKLICVRLSPLPK